MIALLKSIFNLTIITLVLIGCSQTNRPLVSHKEIPKYDNNHPQSIHQMQLEANEAGKAGKP